MTTPPGDQPPHDPDQPPYGDQPPSYGQQPPPYGNQPPSYGQQPSYGGYGQPYPSSPGGYGGQGAQDHPRATLSLILGIVGLVCCSIAAPFAWVIGSRAVREIDESGGRYTGRGQAQAGKILGIIGTALMVLGLLFLLVALVFGTFSVDTTTSTG